MIEPGDDLASLIIKAINEESIIIDDGDVFAIAQKIVSKSENRYLDLSSVNPSKEATDLSKKISKEPNFIQAILNESKKVVKFRMGVLIVEHKLGLININAGIDLSNVPGENLALLLPKNPKKSAKVIQKNLAKKLNKKISIIITDSMTRPYRSGVINFALASHNIQSLVDLKGHRDIYGKKLRGTEVAVADELASAAGLLMGQSNEKKPVVLIKGFKQDSSETNDAFDLTVTEKEDLYR